MSSVKTVAILGASGNIGAPILSALLASPSFSKVTVISRTASEATFPQNSNVVRGEYGHDFFVSAFKGYDAIVSATSSFSVKDQLAMIDAAVEAGVKYFIPSEFGSDLDHPNAVKRVAFFQGKIDVTHYLENKAKASNGGFNWISLVTGAFFDWALAGYGFKAFDLTNKKATIYDQGTAVMDVTNLSTIGLATARLLENAPKHANKFAYINSFAISQNDILAALENTTGQTWHVEHRSTETMIQDGEKMLQEGNPYGAYEFIFAAFFSHTAKFPNHSAHRKLLNEELGLPKEDLEETVRQVLGGEKP